MRGLVGCILVAGLAVRAYYATDLPLTFDEVEHLKAAREISLAPDALHLPLGSRAGNRTIGPVYLTAFGDWVGGGSVFVTRLVFIALSLIELAGVYVLTREAFGSRRAALLALVLASLDRYLVSRSPVLIPTGHLCLVPWALLLMIRCTNRSSIRDWVLFGAICGLGWNWYQLYSFLPLTLGGYLLASGRLLKHLRQPGPYLALGIFVLLMAPNFVGGQVGHGSAIAYGLERVTGLGFTPRVLLLYAGDLLMCLKDTTWIAQYGGDRMFLPYWIPCHWVAGLFYLVSVVCLSWSWRDRATGVLLAAIVVPATIATIAVPSQPFNNFWWAECTLIPALCLAGRFADKLMVRRAGQMVVGAGLGGLTMILLTFLGGPQWGYFCPSWEHSFVGQVLVTQTRPAWNSPRYTATAARVEIQELCRQVIEEHPESAIAWYYWGMSAADAGQRQQAMTRALAQDPNNALVLVEQADRRASSGDLMGAQRLLQALVARDPHFLIACIKLTYVEFALGNFSEAIRYTRHIQTIKPEDYDSYRILAMIHDASGDRPESTRMAERYLAKHPRPAAAYLSLAETFWQRGERDRGLTYLEQAIRAESGHAECHAGIARFLAVELSEMDLAIRHFEKAIELGSSDANVRHDLGVAWQQKEELIRAESYFEQAIALDPRHALAHYRLGVLKAGESLTDEATKHFRIAERLGLTIPRVPSGESPPPTGSDRVQSPFAPSKYSPSRGTEADVNRSR